jgi:hypothetical protein
MFAEQSVIDYTPQDDFLADDGPWTGHDWTDDVNGFRVENGRIFGVTEAAQRALWSVTPRFDVADVDLTDAANN